MILEYSVRVIAYFETNSGVHYHNYVFEGSENLVNDIIRKQYKKEKDLIEITKKKIKEKEKRTYLWLDTISNLLDKIQRINITLSISEEEAMEKYINNNNFSLLPFVEEEIVSSLNNIHYLKWCYKELYNKDLPLTDKYITKTRTISKETIYNNFIDDINIVYRNSSYETDFSSKKTLIKKILNIVEEYKIPYYQNEIQILNEHNGLIESFLEELKKIASKTFQDKEETYQIKIENEIDYSQIDKNEIKKDLLNKITKIIDNDEYSIRRNLINITNMIEEDKKYIKKIELESEQILNEGTLEKKTKVLKKIQYVHDALIEKMNIIMNSMKDSQKNTYKQSEVTSDGVDYHLVKQDLPSQGIFKYSIKTFEDVEAFENMSVVNYSTPFVFHDLDEGIKKVIGSTIEVHKLNKINSNKNKINNASYSIKNITKKMSKINNKSISIISKMKSHKKLIKNHITYKNIQNTLKARKEKRQTIKQLKRESRIIYEKLKNNPNNKKNNALLKTQLMKNKEK